MPSVHIYASLGRFKSFESMRQFIDPTYTVDGEQVDSELMREVGISHFEPMCIEAIHSETPVPLKLLLQPASYSAQWLPNLTVSWEADPAICVFEPNKILRPERSSLRYCGALTYSP